MQKKADGKKIRESKALNQLYREVKIWNHGDSRHGRGNFQEQAYPFMVDQSKIGVRIEFFGLKLGKGLIRWCLSESFWLTQLVWKRQRDDWSYRKANKRLYRSECWAIERDQSPTRQVIGGRPEGARVGPLAEFDDRYVTEAKLLSFLGLNFLMGYHRVPELAH